MASQDNTLIIKHLPAVLTVKERTELLCHFGAEHVQCMSDNGHMKFTAFATFSDNDAASLALQRIHQLDILGYKLSVEFSKPNYQKLHPSILEHPKIEKKDKADSSDEEKKKGDMKKEHPMLPENVNSLSSKLHVNYPINPKLKYMYPPPTVSILTNIANALATVPKFYVQVLHLMNKMNLPAPFGMVTPTPPVMTEQPVGGVPMDESLGMDIVEEEEMVMSSTEESELESDGGEIKVKPILPLKRQKKQREQRRLKLQKITAVPKAIASSQIKPEDVFEPVDSQGNKKIEFNLRSGITKVFGDHTKCVTSASMPDLQQADLLDMLENVPTIGGFGKMEPSSLTEKDTSGKSDGSESEAMLEFISSSELRRNRLSEREMRDYSVFKNYDPGEPSSRLYIKNLHRHVTEKELKYIFGRYVDWSNEIEVNMFDVRLMTEGRMKGQAFVTLGSDTIASRALKRTNAYFLHSKPMVVNFARSAKAKETTEIDNSKNRAHHLHSNQSNSAGMAGGRSSSFSGHGVGVDKNTHSIAHVPSHSPGMLGTNRLCDADSLPPCKPVELTSVMEGMLLKPSVVNRVHSEQSLPKTKAMNMGESYPVVPLIPKSQDRQLITNPQSTSDLDFPKVNIHREGSEIQSAPHSCHSAIPLPVVDNSVTPPHVRDNSGTPCQFLDNPPTPPYVMDNSATPPHVTDNSKSPSHIVDAPETPPCIVYDTLPPVAETTENDDRFITKEMIEMNKLTENEKQENKQFKNYKRGEPSCKLYVKNLNHKLVTEDDMVYIFGKFVHSGVDIVSGLDIKLLREGRMKGQAFITYQKNEEAENALDMLNGYKLYDKPMVIQFGRA